MLIIPKDILFKHVTVNNVQFVSDRKPFLIIKWEEFPVLIELIALNTSADFNQLSINLQLVIIDFRISADSQLYFKCACYRPVVSKLTPFSIHPLHLHSFSLILSINDRKVKSS